MVNTFEIATAIILSVILGVAIWWFIVAKRYSQYLSSTTSVRGANLNGPGSISLSCEGSKVISVTSATQICTDPDENNFESESTDPISTNPGEYGLFNTDTTVDLKAMMGKKCNGQSECTFHFVPTDLPNGNLCGGTSQLIATYSCS